MIEEHKERVLPNLDNDLQENVYATLSAIKGKQFGKDVFSTVIKFKDLERFLEIFPSVQRDLIPRKVSSMRRYIISGLENTDPLNMKFFSAITVTCKGNILYDDKSHRLAIDVENSKLSINDGQHRHESIRTAIEYLENEFVKSKDKEKSENLRLMIRELEEMVVPIVIFDGLTDVQEKQLFSDLNNLAQRPSRNANIRLNQTDMFSRMARELSTENRYLVHYGVEVDKMSIQRNNPNTILLTTIYESSKEILGSELRYSKNKLLNNENYEMFKNIVNDTMNKLFFALPPDLNTKGKYITEKSYAIKAISRFICHGRTHIDLQLTDEEIFKFISEVDWTMNVDYWNKYGGIGKPNGNIVFGGGSTGGFKAIYDAIMDVATEQTLTDSSVEQIEMESVIH